MMMIAVWSLRRQVLLHARVQLHVAMTVTVVVGVAVAVMVGSTNVWRWSSGMYVVLHLGSAYGFLECSCN